MKHIISNLILIASVFGQTTGKIAGTVLEKDSSNPLIGTNVYLANTSYGTATDGEGRFTMINIPPGKYDLRVDMIGYKSVQVNELLVSVNRTSSLNIEMETTVIEGEVVTVKLLDWPRKRIKQVQSRIFPANRSMLWQ